MFSAVALIKLSWQSLPIREGSSLTSAGFFHPRLERRGFNHPETLAE